MSTHQVTRFKLRTLAMAASAALMSLASQTAHALNEQKHWACANTAAWNSANCWKTKSGVTTTAPDNGDFVYLDNTTSSARTVVFGINPGKTYDSTHLLASYTGNMTLNVNSSAANFNTGLLNIATTGAANAGITQSAGTVSATLYLEMGGNAANLNAKSFYTLTGGTLNAKVLELGEEGTVTFTQTAGINNSETLYLRNLDGAASYTLSGTGTLNTSFLWMGAVQNLDTYSGLFVHSGGTHNNLYGVGVGPGSEYRLSGTGKLTSNSDFNVSDGTFNQSGGSVTLTGANLASIKYAGQYKLTAGTFSGNRLLLSGFGSFAQSAGTVSLVTSLNLTGADASFALSGSGSLNNAEVIVGGRFNQTGGAHSVSGDLAVYGTNLTGYKLQGGTLTTGRSLVGDKAIGSFDQSGGTHNVGTLILGNSAGGDGRYNLNGGVLNAGQVLVGGDGQGTFTQQAGTFNVTGNAQIGSNGAGSFAQLGGTVKVMGSTQIGGLAAGVYTLSAGWLDTPTLNINANGKFVFDGGSLTGGVINQNGNLLVSKDGAASTNIQLGSKSLTQIDATFTNSGTLTIGRNLAHDASIVGSGTLYNHGVGTVTGQGVMAVNVNNAGTLQSKGGDLTLAGASFINSGKLRNNVGSSVFINAASVANNGNIDVRSAGAIAFDANLGVQPGKVVTLQGGTLATPKLSNYAGGTVTGFGTLNGDLRNLGQVDLYGPTNIVGHVVNEAGGDFLVRNSQTLITGDLINYGTIRTIKGNVVFEGTLTNNGAYISDPSENHFSDLVVNAPGYLVGDVGDSFIFTSSFINHSTLADQWKTGGASLVFAGAGSKTMALAGVDGGLNRSAYQDNFAWGSLELAGGAALVLQDGNQTQGAALYVGDVLGAALVDDAVSNITGNGYNIYYDASLNGNAYLGGRTFNLQGGGLLMATAPVPEPTSYAMFLAGLGLVGFKMLRSKARRQDRT